MRHRKHTFKLGREAGHRRALVANMLKALVERERIETTVTKAKELRRHADALITLAKENTLASRRRAIARLMVRFNALEPKERKAAKQGDTSAYNADRRLILKLFQELGPRFAQRVGGYTRITKLGLRTGDAAPLCYIEYLPPS